MIRWIPNLRSDEYAQGESRLVWLMSYARWYKAQWLYTKQRFAKGVQRNINWAHFMAIIFFYGFEARCLFSVVFLHMMWIKTGYYVQTRFTNLRSRIKRKKHTHTHKSAKSLKARKVSHLFPSSWLWKLSFWAFFLGNHFAWWAPTFKYSHLNGYNSKLHSHAISGLSEGKKARFRSRTFKSRT